MKSANPNTVFSHRSFWVIVAIIGGVVLTCFVSLRLTWSIQKETALSNARVYSRTLTAIRNEYIKIVGAQEPFISHELSVAAADFPVAYTMLSDVSEDMSLRNNGRFRIFSDFPWPNRKTGGPQSDMERQILQRFLNTDADEMVLDTEREGKQFLVYASPIVMKQKCVTCHNTREDSPRRDWKTGDVRGAQLVEVPLTATNWLPTRSSVNSVLTMVLSAFLPLLACVWLVWRLAKFEKLHLLFKVAESVGDGIICIDESGAITTFNHAAEELFGYTRDEVLGHPVTLLMNPEDRPGHNAGYARFFATNGQHRVSDQPIEVRGRTKSGKSIPVSMVVALIDDVYPRQVVGTLRDLRKIKETEKQLREVQRLKDVGQLTSGVAHDFHNLLQVIGTNTTLLRKDMADPAGESLIDDILSTVHSASVFTKGLLAFADRRSYEPATLNLATELQNKVSMISRTIPLLSVHLVIEDDLWNVKVDQAMFESALVNITFNARDAAPNGGNLKIHARNRAAGDPDRLPAGLPDGQYVVLTFEDDGAGISPENIAHVFDPFFTSRSTGSGRGLGLSMVRQVIRASHGDVTIQSQLGEWTRVAIFLPRDTSETVEQEPSQPATPSSDALPECQNVVLVDDDPMICKSFELLLRSEGMNCISFSKGQEAVEYLGGNPDVDVLVSDVIMPGLGGLQLIRMVQERWPDIPVILMSGHIEQRHGEEFPQAITIEKPVMAEELISAIRLALFNHQSSTIRNVNADG